MTFTVSRIIDLSLELNSDSFSMRTPAGFKKDMQFNMEVLKEHLTPAQRDDLRFKAEREKKKVEMIKAQLVEFKKAKNKISPYELRPGPPARIEVDLTYFLTEQGKEKAEEFDVRV